MTEQITAPVGKRVEWVDILKGIGIIYVIFGHLSPNYYLEKHIYSFHMFLFFFLSGYTYKQKGQLCAEIQNNVIRLLLPFVLWDVLSTLVDLAAGADLLRSVKRMILWRGTVCWDAPIWFLLTLFFVRTIFAAIGRLLPRRWLLMLVFLMLPLGFCLRETSLFLKAGIIPIAFFFFGLGALFAKNPPLSVLPSERARFTAFLGCAAANIIFGIFLNDRISVINCYYGNYLYCLVAAVSGIYVYSRLCISFMRFTSSFFNRIKTALIYIGKHSMFLLCAQYYLFRLLSYISIKRFDADVWHLRGTVKAAIITVFSIGLLLLLEKAISLLLPATVARGIGMNK